jgi:hypothetical protein
MPNCGRGAGGAFFFSMRRLLAMVRRGLLGAIGGAVLMLLLGQAYGLTGVT